MHINITSYVMDMIFKIRFTARGENSINMRGWFIDNVHIYRHCTAPEKLASDPYFYEGIRLTWQLPPSHYYPEDLTWDLTTFHVYRSADGGEFELIPGQFTEMSFIDADSNLVTGSTYCYKVSAVWGSPTDQCESTFSNEECVTWTATGEIQSADKGKIAVFPNPADNYTMISAEQDIERILVYHSSGSKVDDQFPAANSYRLNTAYLRPGAYLVEVITGTGVFTRKLIIDRD
jgi:hypothetical protein